MVQPEHLTPLQLPPLIFTQDPHTTPSYPSLLCPTFNPIIWVKDSAAVIFIDFPIMLLRLQLSAGDWSLWLCCGNRCGASGMLILVPGWKVQRSLADFTQHRGKRRATIGTFIDGSPLSLGPRQTLPDLKPGSDYWPLIKGFHPQGVEQYTQMCVRERECVRICTQVLCKHIQVYVIDFKC